jgi:flagella basal body P-ring formation protein FlgA
MRHVLVAVLLAVAAVAAAPGWVAAEVVVRLAPVATVQRDVVLGDVATVEGDEPQASRVRAVRIGPAPTVGTPLRLDVDGIRRRLRTHRIDPTHVRFEGAERTAINRAVQVVPGAALLEAVREQSRERQLRAGVPAGAVTMLFAVSPPDDLQVPIGDLALRARVQDAPAGSAFVSASVTVTVDGLDVQTVPLTLRSGRLRPVVIANVALLPRAPLADTAVRMESRPSTEVPADALTDASGVADLEAIVPLAAGEVLTTRSVRPRLLIRRGETVTLLVEGRGFSITAQGRAVEDGRRGDTVRVANLSSRREVLGTVDAAGVVRVPFHESRSDR